ncbi:hypothetical protein GALL_502810 [mine drainage metagenome]|uniref:Uncharacterized protein n=1 Tax=mine drainage metagenome TaxID=410659 RepID=A0A1J5PS57_9ZZZZ
MLKGAPRFTDDLPQLQADNLQMRVNPITHLGLESAK